MLKIKRKGLFILAAIAVKCSFFLIISIIRPGSEVDNLKFYNVTGDSQDYIQPVENLLQYGEFRTDSGDYALRTPGYAPIYLTLRNALPKKGALNMMLFVQVILSGMSCFFLALLAGKLISSKPIFYGVFFLYTMSIYVSIWDSFLLTESLASSFIIFSIYFFVKANDTMRVQHYFLSGLFLTWCIFLRPFMVPILVLLIIYLLVRKLDGPKNFKKRTLVAFLLPFILIQSFWILRNYIVLEKFVPLQTRVTYNDQEILDKGQSVTIAISDFTRSYGGDHCYWYPKGASYWFTHKESIFNSQPGRLFPKALFTDSLDLEDLQRVKSLYLRADSSSVPEKERMQNEILATLKAFQTNYKVEHKFHYYVGSRLRHLKEFIFHTGVYNIPLRAYRDQNIIEKLVKGSFSLLYGATMIIGILGSIYFVLFMFDLRSLRTYIFIIPLYIILLFPIVFKVHEFRFSTLSYPFFLITMVYSIERILNFLKYRSSKMRDR